MDSKATKALIFAPLLVLLALAVVASSVPPFSSYQIDNAATILLVVTVGVVAVERLLDLIWTAVDLTAGSAWPLSPIRDQIKLIADGLDRSLKPVYDEAESAIAELERAGKLSGATALHARSQIAELRKLSEQMTRMAPGTSQLHMFAATAAQHIALIEGNYGVIVTGLGLDSATTDDIKAIVVAQARQRALRDTQAEPEIEQLTKRVGQEFDIRIAEKCEQARRMIGGPYGGPIPYTSLVGGPYGGPIPYTSLAGLGIAQSLTPEQQEQQQQQMQVYLEQQQQAACEAAKISEAHTILVETSPFARLAEAINASQTTVEAATDAVATFQDNPARRLLSIYVSSLIGLVLTWVLGLDIFQSVLSNHDHSTTGLQFLGYLGVALTGVVIGLGSGPTHEAIRALQEYKVSRQKENAPRTISTAVLEAFAPGDSPAGALGAASLANSFIGAPGEGLLGGASPLPSVGASRSPNTQQRVVPSFRVR